MIDNISYEELMSTSKQLSSCVEIIRNIIKNDEIKEIEDFISTVDGYSKFLENTVNLYQDADKALIDLK